MKLGRIASVVTLAIAALLAGCTGQSSDSSDGSSTSSASPTSEVVDTFFGLKLELPADKWTTLYYKKENGTYAQIVYNDRPDCVSVACPTLLIQNDLNPSYGERVNGGDEMAADDGCAQGVSAFKSPAFKRTVKIADMTARYYESAPCTPGGPTRRDWLLPDLLITELPGDGRLAVDVFDKLLEGAVKTS